VEFLKNKGLIDDEKSMRGGAGAASPNKALTPRQRMAERRKSSSSSRRSWSPRVSVAQDEV